MKKLFSILFVLASVSLFLASANSNPTFLLQAQSIPQLTIIPLDSSSTESATLSATLSAITSSPAASVQEKIQAKQDKDITQPGGKQETDLEKKLKAHATDKLTWYNPIQFAINKTVSEGVPANTLVLILLFPIITSLIAASRHIIGLKGFGIYTPAVLAVAFVSTGILPGVVLFLVVLLTALAARVAIHKLHLQYLPRTAMLMWAVSAVLFIFLLAAGSLGISAFYTLNIFAILIVMLLTENFMETQLIKSQSEAIRLTVETLILAIACSLIVASPSIQQAVIVNPELTLILVAVFNIIIGRYNGLRLLEYLRFRTLLKD